MGRRPIKKRLAALTLRSHAVLAHLSVCCPPLFGTFPRVTHPSATIHVLLHEPFDLHALGTPPAFILSQDQTLKIFNPKLNEHTDIFLQKFPYDLLLFFLGIDFLSLFSC